jgi:hypothetical protein
MKRYRVARVAIRTASGDRREARIVGKFRVAHRARQHLPMRLERYRKFKPSHPCERKQSPAPCNGCRRHRDITGEGQYVDVALLDPLTNNSNLTLAAMGTAPQHNGNEFGFEVHPFGQRSPLGPWSGLSTEPFSDMKPDTAWAIGS